jgi:pyruvate dehydrogenase E2 component (dihydrolipoamide acetyltransferase)
VPNFGAFGVDGGTAIINPPEAAILGVGRIATRPWVVDDQVAPRSVVELSLVFDHRVADGGVAGGFIRHLADLIETPDEAIADD